MYDVAQVLKMPAKTFFALLNEGHKLDVFEKRMLLTIAAFPQMDEDGQEGVRESLQLPDDLVSDILDSEVHDDINILREALENEQ